MTSLELLKNFFKYETFRPGQKEIINAVLSGRNVLAILPTGAGKSLCYQIPALMGNSFSVIISPLIALMEDQVSQLNKKAEVAAYINSSLDYRQSQKVLSNLSSGKIKMLYVAPEKLDNLEFAERIKNLSPNYVFVDEAHCISQWGHSFRPSYRKINRFFEFIGIDKISAFTATATPEVRDDIIRLLNFSEPVVFVRGFERKNLHLNVLKTKRKKEKVLELLKKYQSPAIIYVSTRRDAEGISEYLKMNGINAGYYHAGLSTELRKVVQDDFITGRLAVITATNAFGMGIDKNNVRLVIHASFPSSLENYYQEFGRAGRDGKEAKVFLLYDLKDKDLQNYFIESAFPSEKEIHFIYNALCDSKQIPIGSVQTNSIPVDKQLLNYLKLNNINSSKLNSALNILSQSGYINIVSELGNKHRLQFMLTQDQIKKYLKNIKNLFVKNLIFEILREFGSKIISSEMHVNITKISKQTGMPSSQIVNSLIALNKSGIINYRTPHSSESIMLKVPRVKISSLLLDYKNAEDLKQNAENKLTSMIKYCSTGECRFKFILEYFGEAGENYKCNVCDNCTSSLQTRDATVEFLEEIILKTIHESTGRLKKREMINILLGNSTAFYAKDFSTFGSCIHFSKPEIETALDSLIVRKLLFLKNNMIYLADQGKDHFTKSKNTKSENNNYKTNLELFKRLRQARKEAATKFSQTAQLICTDKVLREVADSKPDTPSKLLTIPGFTQRAFNKVGDDFLFIIADFKKHSPTTKLINKNEIPQSITSTYNLITKGYSLKDISSLIKLPESIISMQVETLLEYLPELDINNLFGKDEFKLINEKVSDGITGLKELKSILPSNISYAKIRIALAKNRAE